MDKVWLFSRSWWWIFVLEQSCYSTILQNLNRLGDTKNRKSNKSRDSAEKNLHFETVYAKKYCFARKLLSHPFRSFNLIEWFQLWFENMLQNLKFKLKKHHFEAPMSLGGAIFMPFTGGMLFIPDLAVEEVSHVFRAAFYS